jgi:hypothetical protein
MRSEAASLTAIAAALVKTLSVPEERTARTVHVRLAGVVGGLWRCYGELAEAIGLLPDQASPPAHSVRMSGSALSTRQLAEVIEQLTETVLHAPVLARRELLLLLREIDPSLVPSLASWLESGDQDRAAIGPRRQTS